MPPAMNADTETLKRKCEAATQHVALLEARLRHLARFVAARAHETHGILEVSDFTYQKTNPDVSVSIVFDADGRRHVLRVGRQQDSIAPFKMAALR